MNVKKYFKQVVKGSSKPLVANPFGWKLITPFIRLATHLSFLHSPYEHALAEKKLKEFFSDKKVRSGVFKGLQYHDFISFGSSMFPKLLGSYEMELFPVFNQFKNKKYQQVLDVGCAEGFYAVGLAMHLPGAKIYAYDIDEKALKLCEQLADLNGVGNQVILNRQCSPATIEQFDFADPSLLICDCEGYERELFSIYNSSKLKHTDLIIELHPFAAADVKEYLTSLFASSHQVSFVSSFDNKRKVAEFSKELKGLGQLEQYKAVEEGRPYTMEWLIAASPSNKI